jgi:NADH-quinone oxidoreductase subunit B
LEIERRKLRVPAPGEQPRTPDEFRAKQLRARELLRGDLEGRDLQEVVERGVLTTTLEKGLDMARANSIFPATFGLACCAIEMMSAVSARTDQARFGAEALRASPRQADLLILSGRVSIKMAPVIRRLYDQMLEPKWVISMGACSSSGGMFANYAIVQGADKFMPVDVHVPGCPPRPEALLHGFTKLQRKIKGDPDLGWRARYNAAGTEEWARFESGEPTPAAIEAAARVAKASELAAPEAATHAGDEDGGDNA